LFKSTPTKYAINENLGHFCDIRFRELFGSIRVFISDDISWLPKFMLGDIPWSPTYILVILPSHPSLLLMIFPDFPSLFLVI
jgi:hypothetical protein